MKKWFLEKWSVGYCCHSVQAENGCRIPVVEESEYISLEKTYMSIITTHKKEIERLREALEEISKEALKKISE